MAVPEKGLVRHLAQLVAFTQVPRNDEKIVYYPNNLNNDLVICIIPKNAEDNS